MSRRSSRNSSSDPNNLNNSNSSSTEEHGNNSNNNNNNNNESTNNQSNQSQQNQQITHSLNIVEYFGKLIEPDQWGYSTVQRLANFYKKESVQGRNFKVIDCMTDQAKFAAYVSIKGRKLMDNCKSLSQFKQSATSDEIILALEKCYPKQEFIGIGAGELAQKTHFKFYPGKQSFIDKVAYPIIKLTDNEGLSADQEKSIVQVLVNNLDDSNFTEGAATGYINQFKNAIKESQPETVLDFTVALVEKHQEIEEVVNTVRNSYGFTVEFPNKYSGDIHINKKTKFSESSNSQNNQPPNLTNPTTASNKNNSNTNNNSGTTICTACGNTGHKPGKYSCAFQFGKHPDINTNTNISFSQSTNGKKLF
jgi:hypothetical protein